MKYKKTQPISDLLNSFLRSEGLETPLNEHRVLDSWSDVVGALAARKTTKLFIRNEELWAEIKSPAIRADLMMRRSELVNELNARVGFHVIREIHLS